MGGGSGSGSQGSGKAVSPKEAVPRLDPLQPQIDKAIAAGAAIQAQVRAREEAKREAEYKAEYEAKRRRWEADYKRLQAADQAFGNVDPSFGKRAAAIARGLEGSDLWQEDTIKPPHGKMGANKCNIFVYDVMAAANLHIPLFERENRLGVDIQYPPVTGQWANPNVKIGNWEVVLTPRPGDIVVTPPPPGEEQGHMGIVLENNQTVWQSSKEDKIVVGTWGLEDAQKGKVVYRRYVP